VWKTVITAVVLSAVMGVSVHFVALGMARVVPAGTLGELILVGGAGLAGLALYGSLAALVGMDEIRLLRRAVRT
jgi:hypothetical protein